MTRAAAKLKPDPLLSALAVELRSLRDGKRQTRRELSHESGLSERFLADLEAGQGNISVSRLEQLARALGTSAGDLLHSAERGRWALEKARSSGRTAEPPLQLQKSVPESALALLSALSREELQEAQRWLRARFGQSNGQAKVVALLGLRGAGKSTIGRAVAGRLRLPFVELDALVEETAGLSLSNLFALHGEAYYRRLVREVLTRFLAETEGAVLATGGGIVTDREAYRLLLKRCHTVWLQATPDDHFERVLAQGDERPSAASPHARDELRALLRAREPLYSQAELTVDTSRLGLARAVEVIRERVQR